MLIMFLQSLDFFVSPTSFVKGAMHLECVAEVYDVYRTSERVVLLDFDRPKPAGFGWWFSSGKSFPYFFMKIVFIVE